MSALNPTLRVGWQLDFALRRVLGGDRRSRRAQAAAALSRMGVQEPARILDAYPFELSGGQLQRVLLAQALAFDASVIVADEPTTALDVTVQAEVLELIRATARSAGKGILFISHNLAVVWQLSDRLIVLRRGRVVESGPTRAVLAAPREAYTSNLIASLPSLSPARTPLPIAELGAV